MSRKNILIILVTSLTLFGFVVFGSYRTYNTVDERVLVAGDVGSQKDSDSDSISSGTLYISRESESDLRVVESVTEKNIELLLMDRIRTDLYRNNSRICSELVEEIVEVFFYLTDYYGYDPVVMYSWVKQESTWRIRVVSSKGAYGLTQILIPTGREVNKWMGIEWYGEKTLTDPIKNLHLGFAYFAWLRDIFSSDHTAFTAYFWGIGNVRKSGMVISKYSNSIMNIADKVRISLTMVSLGDY